MLPQLHSTQIDEFVITLETCFGSKLIGVYLFGSAACDQLRPQSDVNLLVVLSEFCALAHTSLQPALRQARAAIQLHAMFVEQQELQYVADCFAVKFADIKARHRLLKGVDVLSQVVIKRAELAYCARQMLCNFQLRSREQFLLAHSREEQLIKLIGTAAAPLRVNASALHFLRVGQWPDGKAALKKYTENNSAWQEAVLGLSTARETQNLPEGCAKTYFYALQEIARALLDELNQIGGI
jgi:predicted nucleotidyltransferase